MSQKNKVIFLADNETEAIAVRAVLEGAFFSLPVVVCEFQDAQEAIRALYDRDALGAVVLAPVKDYSKARFICLADGIDANVVLFYRWYEDELVKLGDSPLSCISGLMPIPENSTELQKSCRELRELFGF